ncbi:MAG: hypothetical protein C4521_09990 [Actinobacteria bacterium]|jgi:hypothetical protein|nr:MAG: hypothetical protein C4521_09990 [Actinomycetota bacterium]
MRISKPLERTLAGSETATETTGFDTDEAEPGEGVAAEKVAGPAADAVEEEKLASTATSAARLKMKMAPDRLPLALDTVCPLTAPRGPEYY